MKNLNSSETIESESDKTDFKSLYIKELQRSKELQKQLEISDTQARTYARELSQLFLQSKRSRQLLATANDQLVKYASDLRTTFTNLRSAHRDLQDAYRDTIFRLVLASEYKDKDTGNHINRMSRYSTHFAHILGLSSQEIESIGYAAPMHDVGKIGIPDNIILKRGMLTESEFTIIKTHTTIGADILENSRSNILQIAHTIALFHHEHWNGSGYPYGLSKEKIPLPARIVALSDTFDALTSKRPYKPPYPIEIASKIIQKERERHFDPDLVDIFVKHLDEFAKIKNEIDKIDSTHETIEFTFSERDIFYGLVIK